MRMKRFIASLAVLSLCVFAVKAQDAKQVTETYNNGATALQAGDKAGALNFFKQALEEGTALGEAGNEIVANCKKYIPVTQFSIAKDFVKEGNFDEAVKAVRATIEVSKECEDAETEASATDFLPQVFMQKGNTLLKAKDFAGAAGAYKEVLAINPSNGVAALRLGQANNAAGDIQAAIEAFGIAAANGQEKIANKQLANIYLKQAAKDLKSKAYSDAIANALKSNEYAESHQAWKAAAQASQALGKKKDAIEYFEKYLAIAPNANGSNDIIYTIAVLSQQSGDKAKAKEYYEKLSSDPKYGADVQKILSTLK